MGVKKLLAGFSGALLLTFGMPLALVTAAPATVVVTPLNTQGWSTADTRPGGAVNFITDNTSPLPTGALQLTTDATNTSKAQYLHAANNPLSDVTDLSYSTKQVSGPAHADASYQLIVDLNGAATGGFTTFVYEPYQNGTITPGAWETWDVDAGQFWSTRTFADGTCSTVNGRGGAPFYTLANLKTNCPNAVVVGYGVNIGSNNPSYNVVVDKFVYNETTYDFETFQTVTSKDACKKDGYKTLTDDNGRAFKNQGDCVSFVATKERNAASGLAQY